jgi:hypothetical protein
MAALKDNYEIHIYDANAPKNNIDCYKFQNLTDAKIAAHALFRSNSVYKVKVFDIDTQECILQLS